MALILDNKNYSYNRPYQEQPGNAEPRFIQKKRSVQCLSFLMGNAALALTAFGDRACCMARWTKIRQECELILCIPSSILECNVMLSSPQKKCPTEKYKIQNCRNIFLLHKSTIIKKYNILTENRLASVH